MEFDIQKAAFYKRISAFLFDFILLLVVIVGAGFFLSEALGYDGYVESLNEKYESYEKEYGVDFEMTEEKYLSMTKEEQDNFNCAYNALLKDEEASKTYSIIINMTLMIMSVSVFAGYMIMEFLIPLYLKNGQTLGKKIFGLGVMHTSGIKITPLLLFIRTVLGKYTIETMVPLLIITMIFFNTVGSMGTIILGLILLLQIILVIATPTNSFLHDILAKTVVIDLQSQMIFKDGAELLEYKKKLHAEKAEREDY